MAKLGIIKYFSASHGSNKHEHIFRVEVMLKGKLKNNMVEGTGEVITENGDVYTLKKNDCILIPAGVNHCHANNSNQKLEQLYIFAPQGPEKSLRDLQFKN